MKFIGKILLVILLATSLPLVAQTPQPAKEPLPAQAKPVQGVLVPVPEEIFRLLDRFDGAYWRVVQRPEIVQWKSHGDQTQMALLLGVVVAEGFIAMEGKDSAEVKDIGHGVLALSRGLGVGRRALRRSRSIMDYAEEEKWKSARREWNDVLSDLEKGMIELRSESLSQLVSLAGWLRGTEALCALVLQNYSPARAELLRQPAVIDYLENQLVGMRRDIRSRPAVVKMLKGIRKIRALIERDSGPISEKTVREIGSVCEDLVDISSKRPGS